MAKELFNQPLINDPDLPDDSDRLAFGQPSIQGGKNLTWSRLKTILQSLAGSFINLLDTPLTYTGAAGLLLRVKNTEDGIEFTQLSTDDIFLNNDGGVDHLTELSELLAHSSSPFISEGGDVTDNGDGTVHITEGEVWMKTSNDIDALFEAVVVPATDLTIPTEQSYILYVDYNAGNPQYVAMQSAGGYFYQNWDKLPFCTAVNRTGIDIVINDFKESGTNAVFKNILTQINYQSIRYLGGFITTETGTRNIAVTGGALALSNDYVGVAPIDTSVSSTFYRYYVTNGVWTRTSGQTQVSNIQYNNITTGLVSIGNNKWANKYLYFVIDQPNFWVLVEGQSEYSTLGDAQAASTPSSLPSELGQFYAGAILIAKIIVQQGLATFADIQSPFTTTFSGVSVGVSDHNLLSSLQGGQTGQYFHTTSDQNAAISGASSPSASNVFVTTNEKNNLPFYLSQFDGINTSNPSSGKWLLDNVITPASSTQLQIHVEEYLNTADNTSWLSKLKTDSVIKIYNRADKTQFIVLTLTGDSSIASSTATMAITINDYAAIDDGAICGFMFLSPNLQYDLSFALSDETSDLTTDNDGSIKSIRAQTIESITFAVNTAPTGSSILVDVLKNGVTILTGAITLPASSTSVTITPPQISTTSISSGDIIKADITQIGATTAGAGAKIYFKTTLS